MSIANLTGSESIRFNELHDNWLVFEPESQDFNLSNHLFDAPPGWQEKPEMIVSSGSVQTNEHGIFIEKITYKFTDPTKASEFITNIGERNVISVSEEIIERLDGVRFYNIEVQTLNYEELEVSFDFLNFEIKKGFKIEVWQSGTLEQGGLRKIKEDFVVRDGEVVSDTYLNYFTVEINEEDD